MALLGKWQQKPTNLHTPKSSYTFVDKNTDSTAKTTHLNNKEMEEIL